MSGNVNPSTIKENAAVPSLNQVVFKDGKVRNPFTFEDVSGIVTDWTPWQVEGTIRRMGPSLQIYKGGAWKEIESGGGSGHNLILDVDPAGVGTYPTIQDAVNDAAGDASPTKRYLVRIAPKDGGYNENVVVPRYVSLGTFDGLGLSKVTRLTSASGATLSVPYVDSTISGLYVESTSADPNDMAVRVYDDGLGAGVAQTFLTYFYFVSTAGAKGLRCDPIPVDNQFMGVYGGIDALAGGIAIDLDAASFNWIIGGGGDKAQTGAKLRNGSMLMMMGGASLGVDDMDPLAWAIDMEDSLFVSLDSMISGFNGIKMRSNLASSLAFLPSIKNLGGFTGAPVDGDPGSVLILGDVGLSGLGGAPWAGWNFLGTALRLWSGTFGYGPVLGPDNRPTGGIPTSFQYWATDITLGGAPGPGALLVWSGGAWLDMMGNVIP